MHRGLWILSALLGLSACVASVNDKGEPDELIVGPKADGPLVEHHGRLIVGARGRAELRAEVPGHTFDFELGQERELTLAVEPHSRADTLLTLYEIDSEGRILRKVAEDDDSGAHGASRLEGIVLGAGRYRILVRGYKSWTTDVVDVTVDCESCPRAPTGETLPYGEAMPSTECFQLYYGAVRSPLVERMDLVVRPGAVGLMPSVVRRSITKLLEHLPAEYVSDDSPYGVTVYRFEQGTAVEITHAALEGFQQTLFDRSERPISYMQIEQSPWMEWHCGRGTPATTLDEMDVAECVSPLVEMAPQRGVQTRYREGFWDTEEEIDARALRDAVVVDTSTPLEAADLVAGAMKKYLQTQRAYGRIDFQLTWWRNPGWQLAGRVAISAEGEPTITYEVLSEYNGARIYTATVAEQPTRLICETH